MSVRAIAVTLAVFFMTTLCVAYDQNIVHPTATKKAFARVLAERDFLKPLGLTTSTTIAGKRCDVIAADGSTDEDNGLRPVNHYYDPVHDLPLEFATSKYGCVDGILAGEFTTKQWALTVPTDINEYNIPAAKHALWRSMAAPAPTSREQAFYDLFYALGHVMHLVHDMEQPQHTRNDSHPISEPGVKKFWLSGLNLWSRYEQWCADHLGTTASASFYAGYPVVSLLTYSDYFSGSVGAADYSNVNFVTEHTTYSDKACPPFIYSEPGAHKMSPRVEKTLVSYSIAGSEWIPLKKTEIVTHVAFSYPTYDAYLGLNSTNENHTFLSTFDFEMNEETGVKQYSQGPAAYDSAARLLIPRAVGYSAGLLANFFRGSFSANWQRNADATYRLTVTNTSGEVLANPHIAAYYKVPVGSHGANVGEDLVQLIDMDLESELAPGASATVEKIIVPGLANDELLPTFERRMLLSGKLGLEDNALIALVQPAEKMSLKKSFNFDPWTIGKIPPFIQCAGMGAGNSYAAINGCLTYDPESTKVDSAVYGYGTRPAFWWGRTVKNVSFRLINGPIPTTLRVTYSPYWQCDCGWQSMTVTMAAYEQAIINNDTPMQRFAVWATTAAYAPYWFDDIEWEVVEP